VNLDTLVAAVAGLITGTIGSLVAPWVNWRVQRIRDRTEYRRNQIRRWREAIEAFDFSSRNFADTVIYTELRPYLDEDFRRGLESGRMGMSPGRGRGDSALKHEVLDTITKRERAWKLI
jgi:hypothetical protein